MAANGRTKGLPYGDHALFQFVHKSSHSMKNADRENMTSHLLNSQGAVHLLK